MSTSIIDGSTILFVGDSITDCDRKIPAHAPLGWGYVRLFHDMLNTREAYKSITVVNKGIDGQTIAHLLSRWCDDVIEYSPDILVIQIGINDATRYLDDSGSLHCSPDDYASVYGRLIEETRSRLPECRIVLIPPFFVSRGDDISESYRNKLIGMVAKYIGEANSVAAKHGLEVVDVQSLFQTLLRHKRSDVYSEDKIHPNKTGHLAIAEAVYNCLMKKV
jgi:lysophospholipase L1-like esterase